ncbi:MAG: hypothetical protein LBL61_03115 [Elusimicrobiota bacterium]|jgi:hypothetical protein|nr:hypothetical protein [Elusimicrobiota bacterium]
MQNIFLKLRKIFNLTLAAALFLAPFSNAQSSIGISTIHANAFDARVEQKIVRERLKDELNALRDRLKKEQGAYANYLKSTGDSWKEMPYYKLTPAQVRGRLTLTAEAIGRLLKGSSEYKEYQTGRWIKYGTIFVLFAIVTYGTCTLLGPYFAGAGYTVGSIAGIGLPAVCSVEKIGASVFWTLMLSGSVLVLTDVLQSTHDLFWTKLFGQTYEKYLEGLKENAVKSQASAEDMVKLFAGKSMPEKWEKNETLHKEYLQLLYAFEAIAQELMGNNPNRYEMAWLDIMALAAAESLPEDRTKLENFVKKKNKEYELKKLREWEAVQEARFAAFEGRLKLGRK